MAMVKDLPRVFKKGGKIDTAFSRFSSKAMAFIDRYSIFVSGVVIYLYFLLTSFDMLRTRDVARTPLDFILQFDTLILMWVIAAVVIQLQKYRKQTREQEEYRQRIQLEYDRQRTKLAVMEEITTLLQDNINNPLAIISVSSQNLYRKHERDPETVAWLERIDTALQRVHTTINDIKAYQTQKIVQETMASAHGSQEQPTDLLARLKTLAEANKTISSLKEEQQTTAADTQPSA